MLGEMLKVFLITPLAGSLLAVVITLLKQGGPPQMIVCLKCCILRERISRKNGHGAGTEDRYIPSLKSFLTMPVWY